MITRDFQPLYEKAHTCAPPPLHVYDPHAVHSAWHPVRPPMMAAQHPGPVMVTIPAPAGSALGDDPTDPARQTVTRARCTGMIARLEVQAAGGRAVAQGGIRL